MANSTLLKNSSALSKTLSNFFKNGLAVFKVSRQWRAPDNPLG